MLRLVGLVVSIGLADSMNPSTIAPALYLAAGDQPVGEVTRFTIGVFATYFGGGAAIVLGPGEALLALVPHPDATARYVAELVAGVVMLVTAGVLWRLRRRLAARKLPTPQASGRSSLILGVTITALELPTAFPYFAAIAAIVGSGVGVANEVIALVLYNACFVAPLLAIIATVVAAGDEATRILRRARRVLSARWPVLLCGLALVAGLFVVTLGATGLAGSGHGALARLSRRVRHVIAR